MQVDYSKIPALAPPPGVVPNFVNPVSLTVPLIVASVISLVLAVIFVSVRLYSSLRLTHSPGVDDCTLSPNSGRVKSLTKRRRLHISTGKDATNIA